MTYQGQSSDGSNAITGLVIKSPWIDYILDGKKTWEIRGSATKAKEPVALIKSKSGRIWGTCRIVGCVGPLSMDQMRANADKHQIPLEKLEDGLPYSRTFAWVMADARKLAEPVRYQHPNGAVIFVTLTDQNVPSGIRSLLPKSGEDVKPRASTTSESNFDDTAKETVPMEAMHRRSVRITQGNIDNRHIYITALLKPLGFLPSDVFGDSQASNRLGRRIKLDLDGLNTTVMTDVPCVAGTTIPRKFFREREWVKEFFQFHRTKPGDCVVFEKLGDYHFRIRPEKGLSKL